VNRPLNPLELESSRDHSRSIGGILVDQGRLSPRDAEKILTFATAHGLRFGDAAVRLQLLTQNDVDVAIALQYRYPVLPSSGEGGVSPDVVAACQPQSKIVEPLRALRSQLILRWLNKSTRRILSITSPGRAEGRSWLAANLATVFAQTGERTLLIDADLRNPRQHQLFNLPNNVGLSALLTGRAGRDVLHRVNPQLRLFVLTSGVVPPNPQELLGGPVFDAVLDRFSEIYGVIVLDSPAVTESADAEMLASRAGGTILLARRDVTRQTDLSSAMHRLSQTGANVIGTVFNER
jgi:chain length determinant protein tyrosine kinase EpsG